MIEIAGRSEWIRTTGPCLPKTVLYQAELHSESSDAVYIAARFYPQARSPAHSPARRGGMPAYLERSPGYLIIGGVPAQICAYTYPIETSHE